MRFLPATRLTRLSVTSAATRGEKVQVWFDPDHIQVFDPSNYRNLTASSGVPHGKQLQRLGHRALD